MPATNYTPIQLYRTNTASTTAPSGVNLNAGELAINYNDSGMILYAKNTSGTVIKLMNNPANLLYPTVDGSAGQAIVTNGSGTLSFATAGLAWQSVQTTGFTAVAGRAYPCNTTSAAFTVTLPASPAAGDLVTLTDYAGTFNTNKLTVDPNGNKVEGSVSNQLISTNRGSVNLVYIDSTQGWITYANVATDVIYPATVSGEYLVVAGGGGGGRNWGGGGGAGGFRTNVGGTATTFNIGTTYTITVGTGGAGGTSDASPSGNTSGGDSSISGSGLTTITSTGGGRGGDLVAASSGGSGGGGGNFGSNTGGAGNTPSTSPSQGNNGGNTDATGNAQGGGGGASAVGGTGVSPVAGNGGAGTASSITGSSVTYAGGGGGSANTGTAGTGGAGGGGAGGKNSTSTAGTAGTVNTGGGGGGGPFQYNGGAGGSGIVVIRYPDTSAAAAATTGSPTITVSGGYRIYKWTGNGSITF